MAEQRHLANAPIVEALLDLRVKLPDSFKADAFDEVRSLVGYTEVTTRTRWEARFKLEDGQQIESAAKSHGVDGYLFKSEDGKNVAQFRLDGFTFSRLKPYTEWEPLLAEALRLWRIYVEHSGPEVVTRIAVRYINHLQISLREGDNFDEYLTASPPIPEGLPEVVAQFSSRILLSMPDDPYVAFLTQELKPDSESSGVILVVDVDVFTVGEFDPEGSEIADVFEALRQAKNSIFFASITEKTASLFE